VGFGLGVVFVLLVGVLGVWVLGWVLLFVFFVGFLCGISGAPTTFINGELYAMTGVELLTVVRNILANSQTTGNQTLTRSSGS
jgi:hypothetical protein